MRYLVALFACLVWVNVPAQLTVEIDPVYIDLIPVSQFEYDFIMAAEITNAGPDAFDVSAVLTSNDPNLTVFDGNVGFGDVPAGAVVEGLDPFVVRIDVSEPYDMELLSWAVSHSESPPETGCIEEDWTTGAPTTTACMHPEDRDFFSEAEFFTYQNVSDRLLVEPSEWCRYDLPNKRLYWPRVGQDTCELSQEQLDIAVAVNTSLANWNAQGCLVKPTAIVVTVEFTPFFLSATGGAASPTRGNGHILIDTSIVNQSKDARTAAVLHELSHAAVQFEIFPSALADMWGTQRIWPEAIATAGMIRDMPGSSYFVGIHGPWPNNWTGGITFERARARQAALLFRYLENQAGVDFNMCDFMLNQHALLLVGQELAAFEAEVPNFRRLFSKFVAQYNLRIGIPGVELLPPQLPFAIAPTAENSVYGIANGMRDGDTVEVLDAGDFSFSLGLEPSSRCTEYETVLTVFDERTPPRIISIPLTTGEYKSIGSWLWVPGSLFLTVASPEGTTHMRETVVTGWLSPNIPNDPWPAQNTNDPWEVTCQ